MYFTMENIPQRSKNVKFRDFGQLCDLVANIPRAQQLPTRYGQSGKGVANYNHFCTTAIDLLSGEHGKILGRLEWGGKKWRAGAQKRQYL